MESVNKSNYKHIIKIQVWKMHVIDSKPLKQYLQWNLQCGKYTLRLTLAPNNTHKFNKGNFSDMLRVKAIVVGYVSSIHIRNMFILNQWL